MHFGINERPLETNQAADGKEYQRHDSRRNQQHILHKQGNWKNTRRALRTENDEFL